jgi:hypothetical protein
MFCNEARTATKKPQPKKRNEKGTATKKICVSAVFVNTSQEDKSTLRVRFDTVISFPFYVPSIKIPKFTFRCGSFFVAQLLHN